MSGPGVVARWRRPVGDQRGMALLFALVLVVSLAAAALALERRILVNYRAVRAEAEAVRLRQLARSGIELGIALLADDFRRGAVDHLGEAWARAEEASGVLASEGRRCTVEIVDLSGRIQVNALVTSPEAEKRDRSLAGLRARYDPRQAQLLFRLLTGSRFQLDHRRARRMVAALIDWIDSDQTVCEFEGQKGAEAEAYQERDRQRRPANRPLAALSELVLVRGFDERLVFGDPQTGRLGLADLLTVAVAQGRARGRININTAPAAVLEALSPAIDARLAQELVRYRQANPQALADWRWPSRLRPTLALDQRLIATSGAVFRIQATARLQQQWRRISCVLHRPSFQVTDWREE